MSVDAKICGVSTPEALAAAVAGGARWVGLVFFPRSPRAVTVEQAAALTSDLGPQTQKVALLVDADDALLERVAADLRPDLLQLHGSETAKRVAEIRGRWKIPVMKVVKVARAADLEPVAAFEPVADRLLFDAKPPASRADALPGGNALSFDWRLLTGRRWQRPWMLSGGLTLDNLREAVQITAAPAVDVSSGVEEAPGLKSPEKIRDFLALCRDL
ncbi:phosphoribosylanthranilate isomerase [Algihabitans albus]|uniref:phosphoribosylanthranilate isomerase n=1 Tax=Algihabitans albus TaxID=2164067 RepID=UPI000E5D7BB6|nr:phosphoribosylanthranilate isomerase [Algihabitans albus]